MIHKIYEPIAEVSMLTSLDRLVGPLQVIAAPDAAAPIRILLPDDSRVSLTVVQADELMERLGQARADVVRTLVTSRQAS